MGFYDDDQQHHAPEQSEDLPPPDGGGSIPPDGSRTHDVEQSGSGPLPASLYNVFELICLFTSFITAGAGLCTKRLPKLLQFGIPQTGIQLFFLKPWSSILHNNIVLLLKAILVSDAIDADRKAQFLVETEFFQKARKAVGVLPAAVLGAEENEENENDDHHDAEQVEEGALHVNKKGVDVGRSGSSEIARLLSEQRRSRETAFARPGFYPHLMEMLDEIVATLHFSVLQGVVERSQAEGVLGASHSCITDFEVCLSHLEWWKSVVAVTTSRCVSVSTAPNSPEGAMESGMLMLGEHHLIAQGGDQHQQHLPENSSFPAKNIDSGRSLEEFFGAANKDMGGTTGMGNTDEDHGDHGDRADRSDVLFLARVQQEPLRVRPSHACNFQDQEIISGNQPTSRSLAAADSANGNDVHVDPRASDPRASGASGEQAPPFSSVPVASPLPVPSPYAGLVMPSAGHSEQTTQHSHTTSTTVGSTKSGGTPPTSSSTSPRDLLLPSGDIDQIGEADAPKPEFGELGSYQGSMRGVGPVVGAGLVTGTLVSSPKGLRGSPRSGC